MRQSDKLGRKQDQVWVVRKIYATEQTRYPTVYCTRGYHQGNFSTVLMQPRVWYLLCTIILQ